MSIISRITNIFNIDHIGPNEEKVKRQLAQYNLEIGDKVVMNNMRAEIISFENGKVIVINGREETYPCEPALIVNCAIKNFPSCVN